MPLSEQEKTIIANTITGYISDLVVGSHEDFLPLIRALRSLLVPVQQDSIHAKFRDHISAIRDYMEPWFGAVFPENREELISLCKDIIRNRIKYFESLSNLEKQNYVNEQAKDRQRARANLARMNSVTPPEEGSGAHVISDREIIRQIEEPVRNLLSAIGINNPNRHTFFAPTTPSLPELDIVNNWTIIRDTWVEGYDEDPGWQAIHRIRDRTYININTQYIEKIFISGLSDGSHTIGLGTKWEKSIVDKFISELKIRGIEQSTPGIISYPNGNLGLFVIRVNAKTINDIFGKIFSVISVLDGENSINETMKSELLQSLMQFLNPRSESLFYRP